MITGPRRVHFAYSCCKLAGSVSNVRIVVNPVSEPGGRKVTYNHTAAGRVGNIDKRNMLIGPAGRDI